MIKKITNHIHSNEPPANNFPNPLQYSQIDFNTSSADLVRWADHYSPEKMKPVFWESEKGNFIFFIKVVHPKNKTEWYQSLTPGQVTVIRNNMPEKTEIIVRGFYVGIFDLLLIKSAADKFLTYFTEADTKLKYIANEVTNKFWRNSNNKIPKSTEIVDWIIENYDVSANEAKSIDKICRPEYAKKGGSKPLK